jgi:membrane carboxypeptidase/penicillin-binding protein
MKAALDGKPVRDFTRPSGIKTVLVDSKTGLLVLRDTPSAFLDAFIEGTEPTSFELFTDISDSAYLDLSDEAGF